MTTTVRATFDGEVFRPAVPLDLAPDTEVQLTVETDTAADATAGRPASLQALLHYAGSISTGNADSANNEGIERDLADEAGPSHLS